MHTKAKPTTNDKQVKSKSTEKEAEKEGIEGRKRKGKEIKEKITNPTTFSRHIPTYVLQDKVKGI